MTEAASAVALLFDDSELGGQLREALQERGARIVHEGDVASLSRELLQQVGADVLVVNLDDSADDALDHLYDVIDGDHPRVVFNDAQASSALVGWDRARWARHLAVKVLEAGDIDPPRPGNAPTVEAAAGSAPVAPEASPEAAAPVAADAALPEPEPLMADSTVALEVPSDVPHHDNDDAHHEQLATAESESLAAELEALLASGELEAGDEEESGPGLRSFEGEDLPPLHDGNFADVIPAQAVDDAMEPVLAFEPEPASGPEPEPVPEPAGRADEPAAGPPSLPDGMELAPLSDALVADIPSASVVAPSAPDNWALLDDEAPVEAASDEKPDAAAFGIEKLSAADFLAPDVDAVVPEFEPKMSLELVSMEEAIAPQAYVQEHEMLLHEPGSALSRVILLGASADGVDSVRAFLQALPATSQLTFLHTQHAAGQPMAELVDEFAASCALPVRLAGDGSRAGTGEVLVVPPGQQVRLHRDGKVELQEMPGESVQQASIDATLTMAANAFGRDALAIVFAGRGNDAVAGAQAIHDRGGKVWVESSSGEHFADMVGGIFAERLVSFSGTPSDLAAHLIEVYP